MAFNRPAPSHWPALSLAQCAGYSSQILAKAKKTTGAVQRFQLHTKRREFSYGKNQASQPQYHYLDNDGEVNPCPYFPRPS